MKHDNIYESRHVLFVSDILGHLLDIAPWKLKQLSVIS